MNLFLISDVECTADVQAIIAIIKGVLTFVQWAVPIVLIALGTIDMFKAVSSNDEKATKAAQKKFATRLIYAVVIFLIPWIIQIVFGFAGNILGDQGTEADNAIKNFFNCWTESSNDNDTDDNDANSNSKKCYIYDDDDNKQVLSNITSEKACNEYHGSWE